MERVFRQGNHAADLEAPINKNPMAFVEASNLRRERQVKTKTRYQKDGQLQNRKESEKMSVISTLSLTGDQPWQQSAGRIPSAVTSTPFLPRWLSFKSVNCWSIQLMALFAFGSLFVRSQNWTTIVSIDNYVPHARAPVTWAYGAS